jgi:hypothetical protein
VFNEGNEAVVILMQKEKEQHHLSLFVEGGEIKVEILQKTNGN